MEQVGLVAVGALLSLLTQFVVRELNRKDKADERFEASVTAHREDLAGALSEFFSACATCLDAATLYCDVDSRYTAALGGPRHEEHFNAWLDAQEQFSSAQTDVRVKGFRLLLLVERTDDLVSEVAAMMEPLPRERPELRLAVKPRRERLDRLTERLRGFFVPERREASTIFDPLELPPDPTHKLLR